MTERKEQTINQVGTNQAHEKAVLGSYVTVTETYDWGPTIPKILINLGQTNDLSAVKKEDFEVTSIRTYKTFDFETKCLSEEASRFETLRPVTRLYMADSMGNPSDQGTYIALEMPIGPELVEGSVYHYYPHSGFNHFVETRYRIEYKGDNIRLADEDESAFKQVREDQFDHNINVIADDFNNNQSFEQNGIALRYADYQPQTASREKGANPLIIWLHGAGEGGRNTFINIMGNKVVNLATDNIQSYFGSQGAYILAPQTPTIWMDIDGTHTYNTSVEGSDGHSYYTETLMALIRNYVDSHPEIDKSRIYLGGCSNGGYMTVNMAIQYPDYFAAIFPICEVYDVSWLTAERLDILKKLPVWLTSAKDDGTVCIYKGQMAPDYKTYVLDHDEEGRSIPLDNFSNALYSRLKEAGSNNVHYSLFDHVVDTSGLYKDQNGNPYRYRGHFSWIYALNNECVETVNGQDLSMFEWLSQQKR